MNDEKTASQSDQTSPELHEQAAAGCSAAPDDRDGSGQAMPESPRSITADAAGTRAKPVSRISVLFAVLLSLAALALSVWSIFERVGESAGEPPSLASSAEVAALEARVSEMAERWETESDQRSQVAERVIETRAQLAALREQLDSRLASIERQSADRSDDQASRLEEIGANLDDLTVRLQQSVDGWTERGDLERQAERDLQRQVAMLEAASLLSLAQHRLELVGDLDGARAASRRAAAQLAGIDDARLDRARQALARELEALDASRQPDVNQALARLDRLLGESRGWPAELGDAPQQIGTDGIAGEAGDSHWRARFAGAARGLVRVQARDDLGRTAEQFSAAREAMQLRLLAAQLALVRRDGPAVRLQLEAAVALLDEWFDSTSPEVSQARRDLLALGDLGLEPVWPEIGEALNLLRRRLGES